MPRRTAPAASSRPGGRRRPESSPCSIRRCRARRATSMGAHCSEAAGLFSIVFDARFAAARVDAFIDALKLFKIGYSWAGPVSLAVPYELAACAARRRGGGTLVRFSVGLEAVEDLLADCEQALAAATLTLEAAAGQRAAQAHRQPPGPIANDIALVRLAAAGRADVARSRSGRAASPAHLDLEHRQVAAGADARAGAERHRHAVGEVAPRRRGAASAPARSGRAGKYTSRRVLAQRQQTKGRAGRRTSATRCRAAPPAE